MVVFVFFDWRFSLFPIAFFFISFSFATQQNPKFVSLVVYIPLRSQMCEQNEMKAKLSSDIVSRVASDSIAFQSIECRTRFNSMHFSLEAVATSTTAADAVVSIWMDRVQWSRRQIIENKR